MTINKYISLKGQLIACVIFGVFLLSLSDNLYFFIDGEVGIWQYHCIRSTMIVFLILVLASHLSNRILSSCFGTWGILYISQNKISDCSI